MKPLFFIVLAVIAAAVFVLTACVRQPAAPEDAEPASFDAAVQKQISEESLAFLQTHVSDCASLDQIADVFEQLCAHPTADELVQFEAGTFAFNGERLFTVSLARQIPNGEDEFYQIRAELSFLPDADNSAINEIFWLELANGDDFSTVRQSKAFAYAETHGAISVDFRINET